MSASADAGYPRHPPGWYLVEGQIKDACAEAIPCRLQITAAGRAPEAIPLAAARGGRLAAPVLVLEPFDVAWAEVDDDVVSARVDDCRLRRIAGWRAMLHMMVGVRTRAGRPDIAGALALMIETVKTAMIAGPRAAADLVVAHHLHNLRPSPQVVPARFGQRWWHSGRGALQPEQHLSPAGPAGHWTVDGDDPRFRLVRYGRPVTLPAGWYRLRAVLATESGTIVAPALYPDYGAGYLHEEMIALPEPDVAGRIDVLVLFKWDVRVLRFDPTIRMAQFSVLECELRRVTRPAALFRMLTTAHGRGASMRARVHTAVAFAGSAARHGLSDATRDLYALQGAGVRGGNYPDWVRRYDTIGRPERNALARRAAATDGPLISVLLPVYNTPERWLRRCLDSVLRQAYSRWELCVADDASTAPHVRRVLDEYVRRDSRIRVVARTRNGHISEASNSALELATGEFVGLLDHDDELRPHALLEMAEAIVADPGLALLYSDEDKIDADGRRFNPYFKPDWNPDLLLSQNYVCHFTVIRTPLAREVGGFRVGFEGSQDHDLILRCAERVPAARIRHLPKVLYHWRAIEGSTALMREAKDYASVAGLRAVAEHLERGGFDAVAEELPHGHFRVRWRIPSPVPRVSIIIPTRDRVALLRTCVESVLNQTTYPNYEIVVVDNQSVDEATLAYLEKLRVHPRCRVLRFDAPFNYSAINNWAVAQCDSPLLCLLNNDIEVTNPGWLEEMAGHALRPDIGAVGAMLLYPNRTIQHAGVILGIGGVANHAYVGLPAGYPGHGGRALVAQNLSAVTGACLVIQRERYLAVGGLDEQLRVAFNDIDFCLRLHQRGYRNVWTPFAELCHHESASRGRDDTDEKRQRFVSEVALMQQRWGELLYHDPAYNPNLTLDDTGFELAFPPRV